MGLDLQPDGLTAELAPKHADLRKGVFGT